MHQDLNTSEICILMENSRNEFMPHYVCLFIKLRFVCLTIGYDMVTVRISKKKKKTIQKVFWHNRSFFGQVSHSFESCLVLLGLCK